MKYTEIIDARIKIDEALLRLGIERNEAKERNTQEDKRVALSLKRVIQKTEDLLDELEDLERKYSRGE